MNRIRSGCEGNVAEAGGVGVSEPRNAGDVMSNAPRHVRRLPRIAPYLSVPSMARPSFDSAVVAEVHVVASTHPRVVGLTKVAGVLTRSRERPGRGPLPRDPVAAVAVEDAALVIGVRAAAVGQLPRSQRIGRHAVFAHELPFAVDPTVELVRGRQGGGRQLPVHG